jgi:hypothetical protein
MFLSKTDFPGVGVLPLNRLQLASVAFSDTVSHEDCRMPAKTPQEKKALSLKRDRRNVYGESTKGTRVGIPRSKQQSKQAERRAANQPLLAVSGQLDEHAALAAQDASVAAGTLMRRKGFASLQICHWAKSYDSERFPLAMKPVTGTGGNDLSERRMPALKRLKFPKRGLSRTQPGNYTGYKTGP